MDTASYFIIALLVAAVAILGPLWPGRRKRRFLRRVARFLRNGYGYERHYTTGQVETALERTPGPRSYAPLACAAFLDRSDFEEVAARQGVTTDYTDLRNQALAVLGAFRRRRRAAGPASAPAPFMYPIDVAGYGDASPAGDADGFGLDAGGFDGGGLGDGGGGIDGGGPI